MRHTPCDRDIKERQAFVDRVSRLELNFSGEGKPG